MGNLRISLFEHSVEIYSFPAVIYKYSKDVLNPNGLVI